tara:strand:+ start:647 stop:1531 length:885 start_codon:yes stop_codon:yes gene_type:complete
MVNRNNILVTGAKGQLARSIKEICKIYYFKFFFMQKKDLDLTNFFAVENFLKSKKINCIINCAAYTDVDSSEKNHKICNNVNYLAVKNISKLCSKLKIQLVHISTDYVFDGEKGSPYEESDFTRPLNKYGISKLNAEKTILSHDLKNSIIIRTSLLYYDKGCSFVNKIINKINRNERINVVKDQYSSPTYAIDLAHTILKIIPMINDKTTEIYHFSNSGNCSRYDLAIKINELLKGNSKINASETNNDIIARPLYSVLSCKKIKNKFKIEIRKWEQALEEFIIKQNIEISEIQM